MEKSKSALIFYYDCFNCSIGLVLNLYVVLVILFLNKHLRKQSHYIIQLSALLSNLWTLLNDSITSRAAYYLNPAMTNSVISTSI